MKQRTTLFLGLAGAAVISVIALFTPGCTCGSRGGPEPAKIDRVAYHGWANAVRLTSAHAEVIVVPEIGRVMSFRLRDGENVFWEDRSLDGKRGNTAGKEWVNFGGDKTWPAPEAEWSKYTGRKQWMPPTGFDGLLCVVTITNNEVVLTSPVDSHYGIRSIRNIRLWGSQLSINTTYERVSGEASKLGIWVITQFKEPERILVPMKPNSIFTNGYFKFGNEPWEQLQVNSNRIQIVRDPKMPHKMGSDTDRLIWMGEKEMCVVGSMRQSSGDYPDRGASAEVYTNPDPKKYVELELLGPLSILKPG
ncbi:MAG TPA: hypothetical protein VGF13_10990, partial [Verrucomicrobiae bacterium]